MNPKRCLPFAAPFLAVPFLTSLAPAPARAGDDTTTAAPARPEETKRLEAEVRSLAADINLWNLVNGLQLTPHQVVHVLAAAKAARDVRTEATPQADEKALAEAAKRLAEVREALIAGKEAPESALRAADALAQRRTGPSKDPAMVTRRVLELEDQVSAVLLDSQKEVLRTYKACLIPPKDLKDPVRVGQASDAAAFAPVIDRAVAVPAAAWAAGRDTFVESLLTEEQKHNGTYDPADLEKRRAAVKAVLEEARSLSPGDLMLKRDSLAERLKPEDRVARWLEELSKAAGEMRRPGKIAAFLLDERIVPILEKRLGQRLAERRTPVDLAAVAEAESCMDGHCALKEKKE